MTHALVTPQLLRHMWPGTTPENALAAAHVLEAAALEYGIRTREDLAAWLANCAVESSFSLNREDLYYTTADRLRAVFPSKFSTPYGGRFNPGEYLRNPAKLAGLVYLGRLGNRTPEDGFAYRGGGYIQLTGRTNYRVYSPEGVNLEDSPDLIADPVIAARTAALYWVKRGCQVPAVRGDFDTTRELVNGPARLGLAEARRAYQKALAYLPEIPRRSVMIQTTTGLQDAEGGRGEFEISPGIVIVVNAENPERIVVRLK